MSILYNDYVQEQLPITDTTIYTCPDATSSAHIHFVNCTNEDTTAATITVNIVKSGGSVAATNQYAVQSIATTESSSLNQIWGAVLKPGDFISAKSSDADRLNLKLSIKEIV